MARRASATVLFFVCVACVACARETPATNTVSEVRAVWNRQLEAWNRGDLEAFMEGYWKSPDLVFFGNGGETRGWQQMLDNYRKGYQADGKQMGQLDFPQLDFKPLGSEAVLVRGRW